MEAPEMCAGTRKTPYKPLMRRQQRRPSARKPCGCPLVLVFPKKPLSMLPLRLLPFGFGHRDDLGGAKTRQSLRRGGGTVSETEG